MSSSAASREGRDHEPVACADVAFVGQTDSAGLEVAVHEFGPRSATVVADLPWAERREVVRHLPTVRLVRYRARPYRTEERLLGTET